jgi:hypothetical protein
MPPATPGNVGVSLSGGGSRALTAGMGQLRALNKLAANGQSLLAQVKALSTVSGGSWIGVPFIYLPPGSPSDAAYLGPWIEDQSTLTPAILAQLPAGNAGVPISSPLFAPKLLAVQALLLHAVLRVPPDMLWQTITGLNILANYGLYAPTIHLTPTDTFSFNAAVVEAQVTNPILNPAVAREPIDLYADARDPSRTHRPFLVCNCAMFLKEPNTALELLAPVQVTPFITGIFGTPRGRGRERPQAGWRRRQHVRLQLSVCWREQQRRHRRADAPMVADGRGRETCSRGGARTPRISPLSWRLTPIRSNTGSGPSCRSRREAPRLTCCA